MGSSTDTNIAHNEIMPGNQDPRFLSRNGAPVAKDPAPAIRGDDRHDTNKTTLISTTNNATSAADPHESDAASTFAQSIVSGYTPSFASGRRPLLSPAPDRRRSAPAQTELRKTAGRRAYLGACKALDVLVPIDYNEDKTSMNDARIVQLARSLKKH